ncbi:DUF3274 domain-containing protein [Pseudomonas sp. TMW22090]|nr:DUF3274 domain-containing protein [Pseudomonas sp. TMW22090]
MADWKVTKKRFIEVEKMNGWTRLGVAAQALVKASCVYYEEGEFSSPDLVSLSAPALVNAFAKR